MLIERAMVDANWGRSTDIVYEFCRRSLSPESLAPVASRYVSASLRLTEYRKQRVTVSGFNWMMPSVAGKRHPACDL